MKKVGRRKSAADIKTASRIQNLATELRGDRPFIPRGVYRFKTFSEANDWTLQMLSRSPTQGKRRKR